MLNLKENSQVSVVEVVARNGDAFNQMPGAHFMGDITGHGNEWRCEYVIDYAPDDEDEEAENEYMLSFSLYELNGGLMAVLVLEYWKANVGVTEKWDFSLTDLPAIQTGMIKATDEWDMHKDSLPMGIAFAKRVLALKAMLAHETSIAW